MIEAMLEENPLVAFSPYTHSQVEILSQLGASLLAELDAAIREKQIDGQRFNRAYAMFWLWVLGAYEVTRTMVQARSCFSGAFAERVATLKKRIAKLRMPFAKQEYAGGNRCTSRPISGEASVTGIDCEARDFLFAVGEERFSVRALVLDFTALFKRVKRSDVLKDHREAYGCAKRPNRTSEMGPKNRK